MTIDAKSIDSALEIARKAIEVVELAERGVHAAVDALKKGRADLTKALADLDELRGKLAADDAKHDAALDDKFR